MVCVCGGGTPPVAGATRSHLHATMTARGRPAPHHQARRYPANRQHDTRQPADQQLRAEDQHGHLHLAHQHVRRARANYNAWTSRVRPVCVSLIRRIWFARVAFMRRWRARVLRARIWFMGRRLNIYIYR